MRESLVFIFLSILTLIFSSCSGYTKKDGKVYLRSSNEAHIGVNYTEVNSADYKSFKVIDHNLNIDLAVDNNHVFKGASILEYADSKTFSQIRDYYWRDKNNVYLLQFGGTDCRIEDADPKTFIVINNFLWTKDKNFVYYKFDKLKDLNSKEFTAIDDDWGKDNKSYYYHNLRLDSLDYKTAEIVSPYYLKDKNYVFFRDTIVKDANPKTFKADGVGSFGHDDRYMFDWEKNEGPITENYRQTYIDKK